MVFSSIDGLCLLKISPWEIAMSIQKQLVIWGAIFCLILALLFSLSQVLFPFLVGMAIAYCFDPAADLLEKYKFSRLWASITVTLTAVLIFCAVGMWILPLAWEQLIQLSEKIPEFFNTIRNEVKPLIMQAFQSFDQVGISTSESSVPLPDILKQGQTLLVSVMQKIFDSGAILINTISLLFITPVIAFYFLLDWDNMTAKIRSWLPREHKDTIVQLFIEMDQAVAGFFRGQLMISMFLGSFYAVALSVIGLKFGLLIGIISGILNFIPYIGSITGLSLSLIVAIGQFWPDYSMIGVVIGIFFFGQAIEGNILQPKLVGHNVGLHPVWLMLSLVVFGSLLGFAGLIVAVPLAASIGVLVRFILSQYLQSPLYLGENGVVILEANPKDNENEEIEVEVQKTEEVGKE